MIVFCTFIVLYDSGSWCFLRCDAALSFWCSSLFQFCTSPAGKMLGQILVTKQTGPQGKIVSKVGITVCFILYIYINL